MYFLRWIAGYPILIILLVIGLYALYNKDNLPHWFQKNDPSEELTESEQHGQIAANTRSAEASGQSEEAAASQPLLQIVEEETASGQAPSVATTDSEVAMNTPEAIAPMAEMPEMGEIPPMPEMGEIPPMPEMGEIPPMPEMGQFPPMEPFPEMPMDPAFEPPMGNPAAVTSMTEEAPEKTVNADSQTDTEVPTEIADSGESEGKSSSWLDIFKGGEKESDTTAEATQEMPVLEQTEQEAEVETSEPQTGTEIADVEKEKSGSWLDIFKAKKTEPEETSLPGQQEQPVEIEIDSSVSSEAATAGEEEKSGSWLDIFKSKKDGELVEESSDTAGEYQQQHKESLRLARAAFWQRDYDAAEAIYVNMTKAEPENTALLGEYGNVLLQAGKMGQALDVYEKVAELLIAEGRTFELRPLLYFIGDQDSERAQKITEKMRAQQKSE